MKIALTLHVGKKLSRGEACNAATALDKCRKELEKSLKIPPGQITVAIPAHGIELFGSKHEEHILKQAGVPAGVRFREKVYFIFEGGEVKSKRDKRLAWINYVLVSQKETSAVVELMLGCVQVELKTPDHEGVAFIQLLKCRITQPEQLGPVTVQWTASGEWKDTRQHFDFPIKILGIGHDPS